MKMKMKAVGPSSVPEVRHHRPSHIPVPPHISNLISGILKMMTVLYVLTKIVYLSETHSFLRFTASLGIQKIPRAYHRMAAVRSNRASGAGSDHLFFLRGYNMGGCGLQSRADSNMGMAQFM